MSLANKVVWITGASSGIGEALAYQFAKERAILILSARSREKLENVKNKCLEFTEKCYVFPMDLSKAEGHEDTVNQIIKTTGKVDFVIHSAGMTQRSLVTETPLENDRKIMELNFFSTVSITKLLLPEFIKNHGGHIVVISSIVGKFGFPLRTAYSASKHALHGYYESLRSELEDKNIKVTIVVPGRIKTDISLNALTKDGLPYGEMDPGQANGMPVEKCAEKIVRAIKKEKRELLVGGSEILMVYFKRFIPALYYRLSKKVSAK